MVEVVNNWRRQSTELLGSWWFLSYLQTHSDAFGQGRSEFDGEVHFFDLKFYRYLIEAVGCKDWFQPQRCPSQPSSIKSTLLYNKLFFPSTVMSN
jgi:hypothetical protein